MNLDEQTRTDENRARRQGQQEDLESPQVARLAAGSLVKVHLRAALRGDHDPRSDCDGDI